jgi:hypothetical protein
MIAGGCGLAGAGSLIQLQGAMLDRLWTLPSGQFEKSPLNSRAPVLDVVVVVVVLVEGVVVVVVLTGVVVVEVEVEVVVVGGGELVELFTTGVGFDVLTVEPFLLLAVTTSLNVKPTSAAVSK